MKKISVYTLLILIGLSGGMVDASGVLTTTPLGATSTSVRIEKGPVLYTSRKTTPAKLITLSRGAIVNILCTNSHGSPVSGSGIIISATGVVLTNAHVAQYVALSEDSRVDISCTIRSGSPATITGSVRVIYMPEVWVQQHAQDINLPHQTGTGEHDYAFLQLLPLSGVPTSTYMYIPFDMRPNTAFINDTVVATAYPAEIFTPAQMKSGLYTISSRNMVRELYTFDLVHADAFAMGTSLLAEGGSSGGAVVNAWGYLVGVITSVSQAAIADRDLRAIAISYIDRDITTTISMHIADIVQNRESMRTTFERDTLPRILDTYIKVLSGK